MPTDTIVSRLFQQARTRPDAPAYHFRTAAGWQTVNWNGYVGEVRRAARALHALGLQKGQPVGIIGFNRPEWAVMAMGTMAAGGAPAGIYTTNSASEVHYVLQHAAAPVVLVENLEQLAKVQERRADLPDLRHIVLMRGVSSDDTTVLGWEEFLSRADGFSENQLDAGVDALKDDDLATLIYTSGTTGPPKGVMLTHKNVAWTAQAAIDLVHVGPEDSNLSYLPLSHIAEQMFTLHVPATGGGCVWYAESLVKMPDNLKEVQPTVFFGVPRVWEKFHARISEKLGQVSGVKGALVRWARDVATGVNDLRNEGKEPTGVFAWQYALARRLVFDKLHAALGLGRARILVSGAAPIGPEILRFMASLDLPIREVYGQSEDTGPTSFNAAGCTKFGSVGPALPGVEVKLAEDGEVLVRGPNVFAGYYQDPEATAATLRDGWLLSGDLGAFDEQGFLTITGRKKEIIITAGGKNIAPKNIEAALKDIDGIAEAVVIGDRRRYLTALLTLNPEAVPRLCTEFGTTAAALPTHPHLLTRIQTGIDRINSDVSRVEGVKRFTVLPEPFAIGIELTPTMKVKRKEVNLRHAAAIEAMYAE